MRSPAQSVPLQSQADIPEVDPSRPQGRIPGTQAMANPLEALGTESPGPEAGRRQRPAGWRCRDSEPAGLHRLRAFVAGSARLGGGD